jgi:AcrR family transcriptional regulator
LASTSNSPRDTESPEAAATHLDVAPSAIYHHVKDREVLVALAMDNLLRRQTWPTPGLDWRTYLEDNARQVWSLLEAYPGLSPELTPQTAEGAAINAYMSSMCAHLELLGFQSATPVSLSIWSSTWHSMLRSDRFDDVQDAVLTPLTPNERKTFVRLFAKPT